MAAFLPLHTVKTQTGPGETRPDTQAMKTRENPMTQKAPGLAPCNSIGQQLKHTRGEVVTLHMMLS